MSWIHGARARLHLLFAPRAAERRMDEEISFHVEMETARLMREEHFTPDEARRRALITFGGTTLHKEELREGRGLAWLGGLSLDFRLAVRMLLKHPGLTLVAVVGMAVAVAFGAVTFSAVYTVIDGTLPLDQGDRLISIRSMDTRSLTEGRATHLHDLATWRETLTSVPQLGAYRLVDRNLITPDERSEPARVAEMTASGFRIARAAPLMGRVFTDEDERPGAPSVVVIGYDLWQNRFAGRPDIVGQRIQLGDTPSTIVAVMPQGFAFPVNNRVWTPLRLDPANYERGHAPIVTVFGRLADGATIDDARQQLATIARRLGAEYPRTHANLRQRVLPYAYAFIDNPEALWTYHLTQLLVTLLLVVIGTNVAILVYARTASRMGEIAIRTALGASRRRVVAQLFAEALAMSSIAAVVGLVVADIVLRNVDAAIGRVAGDQLPYWLRLHLTPGAVVYAAGLAILGAVIVGVLPALKATRKQVRASLAQLSAGSSAMKLGRGWTFLIVAQVSVAVAILPLAVAGTAAWRRMETAEANAVKKQLVSATLFLDAPDAPRSLTRVTVTEEDSLRTERENAVRYLDLRTRLVSRLRSEAGATDVVVASNAPGDESAMRMRADVRGAAPGDTAGSGERVVGATGVDLDYFRVFGIRVLAGRAFQPGDYSAAATPVIVNRSVMRLLFDGQNPLGRRIRVVERFETRPGAAPKERWEEIVGVVSDFPMDSGTPNLKVYRPLLPTDATPSMLAVRVSGVSPATFQNAMRRAALDVSPMLRLASMKTLEQTLEDNSAPTRLVIVGLELVTLSTVLLSAAGIYALIAFTLTRRRREIGIRAALGASPPRLLAGVLSRVMLQVGIGIAVGIAVAFAIDQAFKGGWTGRSAIVVLPFVAAAMGAVGLLAAIGPARRALRTQPTEALRSE